MLFWVIMAVLLAISIFLIIQCVLAVKNRREGGVEEDYGRDDYDRSRRKRTSSNQAQSARRRVERDEYEDDEDDAEEEEEYVPKRAGQKQWKILLDDLDTREKYTYMFYDEVGIGRAKDNPDFEKFLTVEGDPKVSKQHCMITRKVGRLYIEDLGSKNGTFLNEERVDEAVMLQKGDVIRVGETRIEVRKIMRERD